MPSVFRNLTDRDTRWKDAWPSPRQRRDWRGESRAARVSMPAWNRIWGGGGTAGEYPSR